MKEFTFNTEEKQAEIEQILIQRKKKRSRQQLIFSGIFLLIVLVVALYCIKMLLYTEFNGYVVVHNVRFRASEDIFVHDIYKHNGDLIKPGDTIYSFVSLNTFHEIGNINSESSVIVKSRDLKLQYWMEYQELGVLEAKLKEIKRQIELEDHNIRFGLSDNVHKLNLERDYKVTEEELKAQQMKLKVLQGGIDVSQSMVDRLREVTNGGVAIQNVRNRQKMRDLGLVNYTVAADSGIVTKNWISELSLVLRGEDIIETQSFDLRQENVYIMAYVTPRMANRLNRGFKATIIVNDDIRYMATVVAMGDRTEMIPEAYRNTLSKDYTAAIAVLQIEPGQLIPFWSLVNGMPVVIRFNNLDYDEVTPDEYLQIRTPKGLVVPDKLKNHLYYDNR